MSKMTRKPGSIWSDSFIPGYERTIDAVQTRKGDVLTARGMDYALSAMHIYDELIEVPVIISKERIDNVLVDVIQTNQGKYRYENFRNLLELNVTRLAEDTQWLPDPDEIESILGESLSDLGLDASVQIAGIYDESMRRKYRDTIASKFIKQNWMYHMQRYIDQAGNLAQNMSYAAVQELAKTWSDLFMAARRTVSPKQQEETVGRIRHLLDSTSGMLSEEARSLLAAFVGLSEPLSMSGVKMLPIPKYVAIDMLADFGICRSGVVSVVASDPLPGDTLVRKLSMTPTTDMTVMEAVNDLSVMDVHEFVFSNIERRHLGLRFKSLERFKRSVIETLNDYASGKPLFDVTIFRQDPKSNSQDKGMILADDILHNIWSGMIMDVMTRGLLKRDNPLMMQLQINDDEIMTLLPQAQMISSGLKVGYDLFTNVNAIMLKIYDYEALDANWNRQTELFNNIVKERFGMIRSADQEDVDFAYATLNAQVPTSSELDFFTPRASALYNEKMLLATDNRGKVQPLTEKIGNDVYAHRLVLRNDVDTDAIMANLEYLIPEPSDRASILTIMNPNFARMVEGYSHERIEREIVEVQSISVGLPDWARKVHGLIKMSGKSADMMMRLKSYGIPYEIKWFTSESSFIEFLDNAVTPGDLKRYGYNIKSYITPPSSDNFINFLFINTDPILLKELIVPSFRPVPEEAEVANGDFGTTYLCPSNNLLYEVFPVNYQDDAYIIAAPNLLFMEKTKIGTFTMSTRSMDSTDRRLDVQQTMITASRTVQDPSKTEQSLDSMDDVDDESTDNSDKK